MRDIRFEHAHARRPGVRAKHFRRGRGMADDLAGDTMTQMNQAFRNIVNMLRGCDGAGSDANYEQQVVLQQIQQLTRPTTRRTIGDHRLSIGTSTSGAMTSAGRRQPS